MHKVLPEACDVGDLLAAIEELVNQVLLIRARDNHSLAGVITLRSSKLHNQQPARARRGARTLATGGPDLADDS